MRRHLSAVVAAIGLGLLAPAGASALSCDVPAPGEPRAEERADVVLEGITLSGERTGDGHLSSPARVLVTRYLRGRGPRVVPVATSTKVYRHGVYGEIGGGFSPVAGDAVHVTGDRVRRQERDFFTGAWLEPGTIQPNLCFGTGTFSPRKLLSPRPGRATGGGWRATAHRGAHGLECVRYTPGGRGHFDECERLRGRRLVATGSAIDGGTRTRPPSTGIVAYGRGLRELTVRVGDEVRRATPPRPGAPAVVAFPGRIEPYDMVVRTRSSAGVRQRRSGRARRVFADDPGGLPAWTAGSAEEPRSGRCAYYTAATPRLPAPTLDFAGAEVCRRAPARAAIVSIGQASCSEGCPPELRDEVRTVVFGRVGTDGAGVEVETPDGRRALRLARVGGAFLAVYGGEVSPAVTVRFRSGSAVTVRGRRTTVIAP